MQVGLLGPLDVVGPNGRVSISGAKERLVLVLLLLRAGEVVSRDALVDALWGDDPPASSVKTLQGYVARVRRALESAGLAGALETRAPGYLFRASPDSIDVTAFERHATAGHGALVDGDASTATWELGEALGLWRGDTLADCRDGGWAGPEALRLDELRLAAIEDRIDADLMLGRHTALVGELESLVARHPLRERLWGELMVSLYRAGRQADALRAYQRARVVLVEELGLEPGAELCRLEAAVLARDPELDPPEVTLALDGAPTIPLSLRLQAASSGVFVGRTHERDVLNGSWKATTAGERRVVLFSGEPGVGKTALAASFGREAFENGAVVLYGRCDDDLGVPYQPWAEVLTHLVAHAPGKVLQAHVDARGHELARLAPELSRCATAARAPSDDATSERYLLFGAVVDVLTRASALTPIVLVIDDLHWADRPTVQLLRHVLSAEALRRLLVIATFRESDVAADHPLPEALEALHREPGVERLAMRGLGSDDVLALLEVTAGHEMSQEGVALRDTLLAETDGNPFFVGELLRHLAETRAILPDELGRWVPRADFRTSGLPVSIREVIGRRVACLGAPTRDALLSAAIIGRDFDAAVLARVAKLDEDTLIDLCDGAVTAALLTEADTAGWYTFAHALIERTLYDSISAAKKVRGHQTVAEALEELSGDDPTERIGELAYHWAHATQPRNAGKAIHYAQRAGDRALEQLAPDEALRWFGDALALLDRSAADDRYRRATLLLGLGEAQRQTGDAEHRATLLAAGRLADEIDAVDLLVRAALRNNRGWNSIAGATDHERVAMLTRALTRSGDHDSRDRARLLALLCVERIWDTDFDERLSMATQAVDIARRTGDKPALVDAIRLSHEAITMPDTFELRLRWSTEACALAEEIGDPIARLHANEARFLTALEDADLAAMRRAGSNFESECHRIGRPLNRWQLAYHSARRQMMEGELGLAEQSATEALTFGDAAGCPEDALTFYGSQLMVVRWMQGRLHEMTSTIEEVSRGAPALDILRGVLACAKSFEGADDEVRSLLDREVTDDFPKHADSTWLAAHTIWATAVARTGHRPAAALIHERLLPWRDQFANAHVNMTGSVAHYLGLLAHTLDRVDEADEWYRQALALHQALEAPWFIAFTQVAWADLLVDRDQIGDAQRARDLADAALPIATERGYGYVERDAHAVLERIG